MDTFFIMSPIVPSDEKTKNCIRHLLATLRVSKMKVISAEEVFKLGDEGLCSCSCKAYQHRAFCHHSAVIWKHRGIIREWPPTLDPRRHAQSKVGRPQKAIRGGALGKK